MWLHGTLVPPTAHRDIARSQSGSAFAVRQSMDLQGGSLRPSRADRATSDAPVPPGCARPPVSTRFRRRRPSNRSVPPRRRSAHQVCRAPTGDVVGGRTRTAAGRSAVTTRSPASPVQPQIWTQRFRRAGPPSQEPRPRNREAGPACSWAQPTGDGRGHFVRRRSMRRSGRTAASTVARRASRPTR
jgi:hypothetical protein